MTSNSADQVTVDALLASKPMPNTWAATFRFSRFWWMNQEDGQTETDRRPNWVDVENFLWGLMES